MSNVIQINKPVTMSSLEIAELTGKQHKDVMADIRNMFDQLEIQSAEFSADYKDGRGRIQPCFQLDRYYTEVLVTGYDVKRRATVIKRWYDLETNKAQPRVQQRRKRTTDPVVLQHRQSVAVLNSYKKAAKMLGTGEAMANVIAVDAVQKQTGVDFSGLLIANSVEEKPVTPTEIGTELNVSAQKINQALANVGLQVRQSGQWIPTEKGKEFCSLEPYKSQNSDHTGYRTLWFKSKIVDLIKEEIAA